MRQRCSENASDSAGTDITGGCDIIGIGAAINVDGNSQRFRIAGKQNANLFYAIAGAGERFEGRDWTYDFCDQDFEKKTSTEFLVVNLIARIVRNESLYVAEDATLLFSEPSR